MVGRSWRRPAVSVLTERGVKQYRACRMVGMTANGYRYKANPSELNLRIENRMREIALRRPRWGLPRMILEIGKTFTGLNHKRIRRLYRLNSLQLTLRKRRKRASGSRMPLPIPSAPNVVWAMDFISDRVQGIRKYRCLNIEDLCTRELLESEVAFSIGGARVTRVLDMLVALRGAVPRNIQTDNGPEFTSRAMMLWCQKNRVTHHFIDPGKPIQNAFMESLEEARVRIGEWKNHYNCERPHSSLNNLTPNEYLKKQEENLTLHSAKKSG